MQRVDSIVEQAIETCAIATRMTSERYQTGDFQMGLIHYLSRLKEPLYSIVDAAQNWRALQIVTETRAVRKNGLLAHCLYEGAPAEECAGYAPYLIPLQGEAQVVRSLVVEGWQKFWAVYIVSETSFEQLRRHLRQFLRVRTPDDPPESVLFRFYDGCVLKDFLAACHPEELTEFFGPVRLYVTADEESFDPLTLSLRHGALEVRRL